MFGALGGTSAVLQITSTGVKASTKLLVRSEAETPMAELLGRSLYSSLNIYGCNAIGLNDLSAVSPKSFVSDVCVRVAHQKGFSPAASTCLPKYDGAVEHTYCLCVTYAKLQATQPRLSACGQVRPACMAGYRQPWALMQLVNQSYITLLKASRDEVQARDWSVRTLVGLEH